MDINTKDELLAIIKDLQSRLAVVEDAGKKPDPEPENEPKQEEPKEDNEVESEDEIEKLLNS